jgi:hypothetical protein
MKTILLLENEEIVGAIFRYMLSEYCVIEAATADEALTLFRVRPSQSVRPVAYWYDTADSLRDAVPFFCASTTPTCPSF